MSTAEFSDFQGLFRAGYGEGFHARLAGNLGASLADGRLIVDNQNVHRDGFAQDCRVFTHA